MIISDSHKFIFFHVPKTAGQSIACKLAPYSNNRELLSPEYELHIEDISNKRYGCEIPKCNVSGKKKNPNHYVDLCDNEKNIKILINTLKGNTE